MLALFLIGVLCQVPGGGSDRVDRPRPSRRYCTFLKDMVFEPGRVI